MGQVPEAPEGVFRRSPDLISFNEPVEDKNKSMVDSKAAVVLRKNHLMKFNQFNRFSYWKSILDQSVSLMR